MPVLLQSHRTGIRLLERSRVFVENGRIVYDQPEGGTSLIWTLPSKTTSCLILGQGSSITSDAARLLAEDQVGVLLSGSGGSPVFLAPFQEYRPTERLQEWIVKWQDKAWRIKGAKILAEARTEEIRKTWRTNVEEHLIEFENAIKEAQSIEQLMGHEATLAKRLYIAAANEKGVQWQGRRNDDNLVAKRLDHGNYLAYGLAAMALWTIGLVPSLPVTHGATRRGGLVFDIADVFKDAHLLPIAFEYVDVQQAQWRQHAVQTLNQAKVVEKSIHLIDKIL